MNTATPEKRYRLSFTTGGLFWKESAPVLARFKALGDWDQVREEIIEQDTLKLRTHAARVRVSRELIGRLVELTENERALFLEASTQEQAWLLWLAACRRYPLVREFAIEVLRENYLSLRAVVDHKDFDSFYFRKSQLSDELESLRDTTRRKLRQNLFRMMREADLLTEGGLITPPVLTHRLVETVSRKSIKDLEVFPVSEADIRKWAT